MKDNESILLEVQRFEDDITLRIDKNGLVSDKFEGLPIVTLKLMGCQDAREKLYVLADSVDLSIYYTARKENDQLTVLLWINYLVDEMEVICARTEEVESDYTVEDLKRKAVRLARLYRVSDTEHQLSNTMYDLLKTALAKRIRRELDLYQRKIDFLNKTNPEKAALLTGESQAYGNVLRLIGLGEVDGRPITRHIRELIGRIGDDHIINQYAHARSVEHSIARLGEAALFPLLEITAYPATPYWRGAAIFILGQIDPEVQKKVTDILLDEGQVP